MISVPTETLREAVARARLLAQRRTVMPIYGSLMIQGRPENAWVTITAACPEAQIAVDVDSDVDVALAVCVDADKFALSLNAPGDKTKLSIDGERLKVVTGKSVFRIPHQPRENFPLLLSQGDKVAAFESPWLGEDLSRVLPFTGSSDHVRIDCRGVSLKGEGGKLKIEGTTGAMCASITRDIADIGNFAVMLPSHVCEVLAEINPTRTILKEGTALFLGENVQLTSTYLQAVLGDVSRVFPGADAPQIKVPRRAFIEAVKSVSALSDMILKRSRPVKLVVADGAMGINAVGQAAEGRAEVECVGEKWQGTYDAGFVLALESVGSGDDLVLVTASNPERLAVQQGPLRAVVTGVRV